MLPYLSLMWHLLGTAYQNCVTGISSPELEDFGPDYSQPLHMGLTSHIWSIRSGMLRKNLLIFGNAVSCIKRSLRLDHCRSVSSFQESSLLQVNGVKKQTLIPGLTENTRYFVRLVAVGCRGKSQPTKWAKAKTPVEGGSPRRRNADSSPKKKATAQPLQQPMGDGQSSQIGKYWHLYCKQQVFFYYRAQTLSAELKVLHCECQCSRKPSV